MHILGVDFTSAPTARKPIVVAHAELLSTELLEPGQEESDLNEPVIVVDTLEFVSDWTQFDELLCRAGPWVAGCDFPLGQPAEFVFSSGLPASWSEYVADIAAMGKDAFVELLLAFAAERPSGQKQLKRVTDVWAASISPMMVYGVPMAKMFFEGATRLLQHEVSILPCRPRHADDCQRRLVVESYPALMARRLTHRNFEAAPEKAIKRRGEVYKGASRKASVQFSEQRATRGKMLNELQSLEFAKEIGLAVELSVAVRGQAAKDPLGDCIDSVLAAVETARWYHADPNGERLASHCDPNEGIIACVDLWRESSRATNELTR